MRTLVLLLVVGCAGAVQEDPIPSADAGAADATPTTGCGLSFDEAVEAYPDERVCQTTVYELVTGYCTHWQPCSSL